MVEVIIFHCKCRFGIVKMPTKTPWDLDLYPAMDHRQMRVIDAKYRVRMGYWALQNNVQEYNERFNGGLGRILLG
jgi:hypothetical protein